MKTHKINKKGLDQIASFLMKNHRNFQHEHPNENQLHAWAFEAEQHADNGNGCYIEITSFDSIQYRPQILDLNHDCFDVVEVKEAVVNRVVKRREENA